MKNICNKITKLEMSLPCKNKKQARSSSLDQNLIQPIPKVKGQSSPSDSKCERANKIVDALTFVIKHHGAPDRVVRSMQIQITDYLDRDITEAIFIKRVKHLTLWPMSRFLNNEPPSPPDRIHKFIGSWRAWANARMNSYSKKNVHLWYSWLQAKRGAAEVSKEIVYENFLKHRHDMGLPDPLGDNNSDLENLGRKAVDLLNYQPNTKTGSLLRRTAVALKREFQTSGLSSKALRKFGEEGYDNLTDISLNSHLNCAEDVYHPTPTVCSSHTASLHACLESGRKSFGQLGYIHTVSNDLALDTTDMDDYVQIFRDSNVSPSNIDEYVDPGLIRFCKEYDQLLEALGGSEEPIIKSHTISARELTIPSYELRSMRWHPGRVYYNLLERSGVVTTRYCRDGDIEKVENLTHATLAKYLPGNENSQKEFKLHAQVEAVLEPLKVRTISKGEGKEYYVAKKAQKILHSHLRKLPPFRLIGRPFMDDDLIDVRDEFLKIPGVPIEEQYWLSIDYSSATDQLSATYSSYIMDEVCKLCNDIPEMVTLIKKCLAPHRIHYPDFSVKDKDGGIIEDKSIPPIDQLNGQLMGSPISFPILCLANLGLYLLVKREELGELFYKPEIYQAVMNSVLINGDDMLYIGTIREWNRHIELGKAIGLSISPGKAYIHKRYANINSISLDFPLRDKEAKPTRVGFFNVGLLVGNHKVMNKLTADDLKGDRKDDVVADSNKCSVINELLSGCLEERQCKVLKLYLSLHKRDITRECKGRQLFWPISSGGMGVRCPDGFKYFVSKKQRHIYCGRLLMSRYLHSAERPLQYPPMEEVNDLEIGPFKVSDAVPSAMQRPRFGSLNLYKTYNPLLGLTRLKEVRG